MLNESMLRNIERIYQLVLIIYAKNSTFQKGMSLIRLKDVLLRKIVHMIILMVIFIDPLYHQPNLLKQRLLM